MTAEVERAGPGPAPGAGRASGTGRLSAGTTLAGRYAIEQFVRSGPFAEIYHATDGHTGDPVSVHLVHAEWLSDPEVARAMLEGARAALELDHKNIARTLEVQAEGDAPFVVTELLEGAPLREVLDRKRQAATGAFGARAANNLIGGVCNALTAAHIDMAHGAVGPDSVYVNKAGRVKVTDFGLGAGLPAAARAGARAPTSLAPEDARSGAPSGSGDVFATGALLYEVLVGQPLQKGGQRPSQAADVGPAVDELVATCCSPQADRRPGDAAALKAVAGRALRRPSGQRPAAQPAAAPAAPAASSGGLAAAGASSGSQAALSLDDTEERWLVSKGRLDYGPFTFAQLVEQIQTDEVLPGHTVVDNDTGERSPVEDHPLLAQIVDQARQARDDRRRAQAEVSHAKQETRRGFALYGFVGAGVLGLAVAAWFIVKSAQEEEKDTDRGGIASIEEGELQPKFSFPEPKKKRRRSSGGRRARPSGGGGGEEAGMMDFSDDVGNERLDSAEVNGVIQRHGGRLGGCLSRNGGGYANIQFLVKGKTGRVYSVKVNGDKSGSLYNCINRAMRSMQFRKFDGLRSGHEFEMSL